MDAADLEQTLRDLDRVATPVRRRPNRETWRFEFNGRAFYLHFYPPAGGPLSRGGATAEFAALKTLQTLKLPAVRPVALLSGLQFGDRKGDAVLTAAVEPALRLDAIGAADHVRARAAVIDWLTRLAAAGLGHSDLRPGSFLLTPTGVVLADAIGLVRNGLTREHLTQFAFAAGEQATLGDRVRAWRRFDGNDEVVPPADRQFTRRVRQAMARQAIGRIKVGKWTGQFLASAVPVEWSTASRLSITAADWQREWPRMAAMLEADGLDVLKRDGSGDVLSTQITLAGVPINVIVKRPRNKSKVRDLLDVVRPSRAHRTWMKTRRLLATRVPVEQPLAMFRQGRGGDVLVFERVPGVTLEHASFDATQPAAREMLFRRCGRLLRQLEDARLAHTDAKSSNWIVFNSPTRGPMPVMIDAYGIRWLNPWLGLFGLHRLLRAMKHHPQYTPADSLHICQGFAPRASPGTEAEAPSDAR
ncbi:MAG TPA: hypothetical protein VF595_11425 [Tepidisphaeraceae bacterium]